MRVGSAKSHSGRSGSDAVSVRPAASAPGLCSSNVARDQLHEVDPLLAQRDLAGGEAADVEQVVEQVRHVPHLRARGCRARGRTPDPPDPPCPSREPRCGWARAGCAARGRAPRGSGPCAGRPPRAPPRLCRRSVTSRSVPMSRAGAAEPARVGEERAPPALDPPRLAAGPEQPVDPSGTRRRRWDRGPAASPRRRRADRRGGRARGGPRSSLRVRRSWPQSARARGESASRRSRCRAPTCPASSPRRRDGGAPRSGGARRRRAGAR